MSDIGAEERAAMLLADQSTVSTRWANIKLLTERLSPPVQEIVRLDLIQTVGCFLRHARNEKAELMELEEIAVDLAPKQEAWGAW